MLLCAILLFIILILIFIILGTKRLYNLAINTKSDKSKMFSKGKNKIVRIGSTEEELLILKSSKDVYIESNDGLKLHAYEFYNEKSNNWIIVVHGFSSSANLMLSYVLKLSKTMNVLYIDQRGHGQSEGNYTSFGIKEKYDVLNWIKYLNKQYNASSIGLFGLSMGAATVMMASSLELPDNVKYIIEDSGYTSSRREIEYQLQCVHHIPSFLLIKCLNIYLKKRYNFSLNEGNSLKDVEKTNIPMLFIHGSEDYLVPTKMVYKLYEAKRNNKELLVVEGAGHVSSMRNDYEKYWKKVDEFISKYSN